MNAGRMTVLALVLGTAGCGEFVEVRKPFAEERASLPDGFSGRLVLADGAGLEMGGGRVLGDWVCGTARGRAGLGDMCIKAERVKTIERSEWRAGPADGVGQAVTFIIMWPLMAAFSYSEHENDRANEERAKQDRQERSADEARAAARGEVLPPLPTPESRRRNRAFAGMAQCRGLERTERKQVDGQTLAAEVLMKQDDCLSDAIEWFDAVGDQVSARRLTFIQLARSRYEELICRGEDVGLRAPQKATIAGATGTWMSQYRAIVADTRTYDYEIGTCRPAGDAAANPAPSESEAKVRVASSFPLTNFEVAG